jgi:hypothetical protein
MKPIAMFIKVKKLGQSHSDASGWNKHVNRFQKRIGNQVIRRIARRDMIERSHD